MGNNTSEKYQNESNEEVTRKKEQQQLCGREKESHEELQTHSMSRFDYHKSYDIEFINRNQNIGRSVRNRMKLLFCFVFASPPHELMSWKCAIFSVNRKMAGVGVMCEAHFNVSRPLNGIPCLYLELQF